MSTSTVLSPSRIAFKIRAGHQCFSYVLQVINNRFFGITFRQLFMHLLFLFLAGTLYLVSYKPSLSIFFNSPKIALATSLIVINSLIPVFYFYVICIGFLWKAVLISKLFLLLIRHLTYSLALSFYYTIPNTVLSTTSLHNFVKKLTVKTDQLLFILLLSIIIFYDR